MFSLNFDQKEIETALTDHIRNLGIDINGRQTKITLIAGRKENGMSAQIELTDETMSDPVDPPITRLEPTEVSLGSDDEVTEEPTEDSGEGSIFT